MVLFIMFLGMYFMTKRESTYHGDIGYEVTYDWSILKFIWVTLICILAGLSTTSIGIGLAFLCSPLLRSLNFPEEISEQTPLYIELCVRTVNIIQFMIRDSIDYKYALFFAAWVVPGALLGTFVLTRLISTHFKTLMMLLVSSVILAIACIATIVFDLIEIVDEVNTGKPLFNFYGYCEYE